MFRICIAQEKAHRRFPRRLNQVWSQNYIHRFRYSTVVVCSQNALEQSGPISENSPDTREYEIWGCHEIERGMLDSDAIDRGAYPTCTSSVDTRGVELINLFGTCKIPAVAVSTPVVRSELFPSTRIPPFFARSKIQDDL